MLPKDTSDYQMPFFQPPGYKCVPSKEDGEENSNWLCTVRPKAEEIESIEEAEKMKYILGLKIILKGNVLLTGFSHAY